MKLKFRLEDIYRYLLTVVLWKTTFVAPLSWITGARLVANQVSSICTLLILFLSIVYVILKVIRYPSIYDLVAAMVLFCAYLSYKTVADETFLYAILLVILAKPFDIKRTLKLYYKNIILILVSILIVFFGGLTNDNIVNFTYSVGHSLGTGHPNVIAALILNATLLGIILHLWNKAKQAIALSLIVAVVIYVITASRTSSILLLVFAVIYSLYLIMQRTETQWIMNVLKLAMVTFIGFSLYMMVNNGQIFGFMDTNFYVRFVQANRIFNAYGIHLWGSDITFVSMLEATEAGVAPVILDNGYLRLLLYYGSVAFILFIIGIIVLIRKISKQKNYTMLLIIALFLAGGLMEKTVYSIQFNFSLLFITTSIDGMFENCTAENTLRD